MHDLLIAVIDLYNSLLYIFLITLMQMFRNLKMLVTVKVTHKFLLSITMQITKSDILEHYLEHYLKHCITMQITQSDI